MSRRRFPWDRLGIDETGDTGAIRKAYADALRATNVDENIAGYADLRRARDQALWLAAQSQRAEEEDESDLGLGDLGDDHDVADDADWLDDDYDDDLWDDDPSSYHPDPFVPAPDPALSEGQERARAAWQQLTGILYPEGAASDDAVTLAEMEEGLAALDALIARADEADIAEHDALDGALADLFARTWPRSAPFVEPANAAFHWLAEDGSIEERLALMFLNQRLKGMRFHDKVQQPGHPLHKAWAELSRPGRAKIADRLKVKRLDVHKLLTGIRDRYPELESHLAAERVASWDSTPDSGASGFGPRAVRGIIILLVLVALPRLLSQCTEQSDDGPPLVSVAESQLKKAKIDAEVVTIFGPGIDMKVVLAEDPKLARDLLVAINNPEIIVPLHYVRMQALASAEVAPRAALEARAELKAIWLTAAQSNSAQTCRMAINGDLRALTLDLDKQDRAREKVLLRQLLAAKVLSHMPKGGETRYNVPGWLVGETRERSGLSEEQLKVALTDPDSADRCKAETALVQAVVAAPKKVPDDVLKGL